MWGMAGGNQPRLRCSPYRTCRFAMTLGRVYTTWGVLWAPVTSIGDTSTILLTLLPAELTHCHYRTTGLNRDGSLKHDHPSSEWQLVPLGHWNWKWNQARSNYSIYDQELLAGMPVLSSQSRTIGI